MNKKWCNAIALILLGVFFALHCAILGKFELCVFRSLCGLPCPGCGLTHAAAALFLHGDIVASLGFHALFLPLAGTLFFCSFPHGVWRFADRVKECRVWLLVLFGSVMVYYMIRLILFFPSQEYPMLYDPRNYLQIFLNWIRPAITTTKG